MDTAILDSKTASLVRLIVAHAAGIAIASLGTEKTASLVRLIVAHAAGMAIAITEKTAPLVRLIVAHAAAAQALFAIYLLIAAAIPVACIFPPFPTSAARVCP